MATLSRKTLGVAARCIEGEWCRAEIETFFYEMEVPNELVEGDSKLKMVLNVFKGLEAQRRAIPFSRTGAKDESRRMDLLGQIVFEVATRLQGDNRAWLHKALMEDGFVLGDGIVAVDVPVAEDNRTALEILVERNSSHLTVGTLTHHLCESMELFRQEKWDSSIAHARNFVEQLLCDIAKAIAQMKGDTLDLGRPVRVRDYLVTAGFFDTSEKMKLADGVYGFFSEEGSHPGVSTQSAARVCMHVLWAFGFYILEKFENRLSQNAN